MAKNFIKILLKTYNRVFILVGVIILFFACAFYLLLGKQAADSLIEQMFRREEVIAKSGAISLNVFIDGLGNQISAYSTRSDIMSFDPRNAQKDLEILLDRWKDTPVSGVILVDSGGTIKYGVDRDGNVEAGQSVADREYFTWAKSAKEGEKFVGIPIQSRIGFSKGRYIVPVASPVFRNGQFRGTIVISFLLDEMADKFLNPLKISDKTRIYLIDRDGVIFSGPVQKLVGVNYLDYIEKSGFAGSKIMIQKLRNALASDSDNTIDIALPDETKNGAPTRYLIAYSPFDVGDNRWLLGVATPASDALEFLAPFYFNNLGLAVIAFFGFLIIAIRISKIRGYVEGEEEEHKLHIEHTEHTTP